MIRDAIIYLQVPPTYQRGSQKVSLKTQEKECTKWAIDNSYRVKKICQDDGFYNRKGLSEIIQGIEEGDTIIVYALNCLSRNTTECLNIIDEIRRKGASVYSITEKIDTESSMGKIMINMISSIAQFYPDDTSERIRTALKNKKENGLPVGKIPYGYCLDERTGRLKEDATEQIVIRLIQMKRKEKDEKGNPKSYRQITDELNREKIPPRPGTKKWYYASVYRILNRDPVILRPSEEEMTPKLLKGEESSETLTSM